MKGIHRLLYAGFYPRVLLRDRNRVLFRAGPWEVEAFGGSAPLV